jgi:glycosyltransferase involved in cell wall biosynthesis
MKQPAISICLPVYNGENYLNFAIESVLAQTLEDFELLIVDDCSTDATSDIANNFAQADKRIKVMRNQENLGLFRNYNRCMESASGEFIKLFAHDDLFKPTILERMVAIFERYPNVALVAAGKAWVDENGCAVEAVSAGDLKTMKPFSEDTLLKSEEAICQTLRKMANWLGEPCSQMFRRQHAKDGFDCRFLQVGDLDFSYRILEHGDYYHIADELCSFRMHQQSNSHRVSRSLDALLDWFVLGAKHKNHLPAAGLTENEYAQLLTKRLSGILFNSMYGSQKESRESVVESFLRSHQSALSSFGGPDGHALRVSLNEFKALAVLSMIVVASTLEARNLAQNQVEGNAKEIEQVRAQIKSVKESLGREAEELRSALSAMGDSLSWKITEPLRNWRRGVPFS